MKYVDVMNRPRTESLFVETIHPDVAKRYPPVFTMKEKERNGCPSAYQIYMDADNEYDAAMKITGCMRHWRRLCGLKWFMDGSEEKAFDGLNQWREDKAAKDELEAIKLLKEQAENGNVTAQKILFERNKPKGRAGRPQKDRDQGRAKEREDKILNLHKKLTKK